MSAEVGSSLGLAWNFDQVGLEFRSRYQAKGISIRGSPILTHGKKQVVNMIHLPKAVGFIISIKVSGQKHPWVGLRPDGPKLDG
jgi:hypothetical protein